MLFIFCIFVEILKHKIMSKRKVFEKQIVDISTGEIYSEEVHYSSNDNETFGMHRTTEGVDWVFQFTGIELQMMIVLLEIEDLKTGIVSLTPLMKQHISSKFEKTGRYMREIIASLESKNALYKITTQDIILNPIFMYKGGTKVFKTKLNTYNSYKTKPSSI